MTKKEISLVVLSVVLIGLYVSFFTDLFRPKIIQIQHTARPFRAAWSGGQRVTNSADKFTYVVSFVMNRDWKVDEIKAVVAAEYQTNKFAHPIWQLVPEAKSPAVRSFVFGGEVPGMRPSVPGAEPDPIVPGVLYKMVVRSGKRIGEHDFQINQR